jgi:hypothetical protein
MDPESWKQQWTAFWSAPAIIGPLLMVVGVAVWWFSRKMFEAQIAGLKEQIAALKERLDLAADLTASAERDLEKLEKEFQDYKERVAVEGSKASPAKVDAAIVKVSNGNTVIRKKLFDALMSRETAVIHVDGDPKIR